MKQLNNLMCEYLSIARYSADFWNGTVFRGKRRIKVWQLERWGDENNVARYRGEDASGLQKNVWMLCKGKRDRILAVEVMNRIGTNRFSQIQYAAPKGLPLRTIVLYCGVRDCHGPNLVNEIINIESVDDDFKQFLREHPIRIYNLMELREENFETSLRELVAVFKRSDNREALKAYYLAHEDRFRRLDALSAELMSALLGLNYEKLAARERGGVNLCKAFEDERLEGKREGKKEGLMEGLRKGRKQGIEEGKKEGLEAGRKEGIEEGVKIGKREGAFLMVCTLVKSGTLEIETAASSVNMSVEVFSERMQEFC